MRIVGFPGSNAAHSGAAAVQLTPAGMAWTVLPLMLLAGAYAEAFALRAYDSLPLAAMQMLRVEAAGLPRMACFDT
jgi:hypothetical protein